MKTFDLAQRTVSKKTLPVLLADFYKTSHRSQYKKGTKKVFANWIPRKSRIPGIDKVVCFGIQGFAIRYLIDYFNENFFSKQLEEVIAEYERFMRFTLGEDFTDSQHIADLHRLGYLPIRIEAVKEGTAVPIGVPMLTVANTIEKFFWVTNYIETLISCEIWGTMTAATLANEYRKILEKYAMETTGSVAGVEFQGHDFSMRGMLGVEASVLTGMGHLTSFVGTDTMPAIQRLEVEYGANIEEELVGCSVPATEHSVECVNCQGTLEGEYQHTKRLITEIYPRGIVSKVSDTFDLWSVITKVLPRLKDEIMGRDGKLVIRPDSGDPVDILCGTSIPLNGMEYPGKTPEEKGVVELLWDIFGGTVNDLGYKILDPHIGAIYGDSITIERCEEICARLKAKGFASVNIVLGIGSFTYQYNTRDTFGFAMKSTYAIVNDEEIQIQKDPITDDGTKKSLKGLCYVEEVDGELTVVDNLYMEEYLKARENGKDKLILLYENGKMFNLTTLEEVRKTLRSNK